MKVIFDANVFISYLLPTRNTNKAEAIHYIVDAGFEGKYTLVFPQELIAEIRKKVRGKQYLIKHIAEEDVNEFVVIISSVAEFIPPIIEDIPIMTRDPKDDYLLAYGVVGECDYLVTGDDDLLILKQVENLKIIKPAEFLEIIKEK